MKYFSLLKKEDIVSSDDRKIIPSQEFETLLDAKEIVKKIEDETDSFRKMVAQEAEKLKEEATRKGYEQGLIEWNEAILKMEKEILVMKKELEKAILPLAVASVRKIIGRELELKNDTIVDIVAAALKNVSTHKKVKIFVRKNDLDILEKNRPRLKALFEQLQSLDIAPREDIQEGSCVIETEGGILNISLEAQIKALESVFAAYLQQEGS